MKVFWKKALAVLLAAVLTLGIAPAANLFAVIAAAQNVSGTCGADGDNLVWTLDADTGVLTVSGSGDMADYSEDDPSPWAEYADVISSAVIESGVTSVGDCAFNGCAGLTQVSLGSDVTRVGGDAFAETGLIEVFVPAGVREIGPTAFVGLTVSGEEDDEEITPTLQRIDVDPANEAYASVDGVLYNKTQTVLIQYPCGKADSAFTVPNDVTEIADLAFPYCLNLQSLTLPDGLTTIGSMAFLYSYMLQDINIPGSVTSFGEEAFIGCLSLRSVTFENGITEIPDAMFAAFESLETVTLPGSVTTVGAHAFDGCVNLTNLTLGAGVEAIGERAFYGCASIGVLTLPDSVVTIGDQAFAGCADFGSLTIPADVTAIGSYAFSDCTSLTELTFNAVDCADMSNVFVGSAGIQTLVIGSGVTRIPADAFLGLESITQVCIPDSVTAVGAHAFQNCRSLADVTIGSGVQTIGDHAFQNCAALTDLHIPSGVAAIGSGVFDGCENLAYICSDSENCAAKTYAAQNGIEFRLCSGHGGEEPSNTVDGVCGVEGNNVTWTLDLDTGVMTISGTGDMADYRSDNTPWADYRDFIAAVVIENGVTSVGKYAFTHSAALASVTLADSVTTIGEAAFAGTAVADITLPDGVTNIGGHAFSGCNNLTEIAIPDTVTNIADSAFVSCTRLAAFSVSAQNTDYSNDANGVLYNKDQTALIQYPCGNTNDSFEIPSSVTTVGNYAFAFNAYLHAVTIPDSTTSVGDFAFMNCTVLESVLIGGNVTYLGKYAFGYCASLLSADIPDSLYMIGDSAFCGCTSLANAAIGKNVTTICEDAFSGTGLTTVILPDGLTKIDASAFADCVNLMFVHVPSTVTTIGDDAFTDCPNLAYICCDTADCYAKTYAAQNGIAFRLCAGHDNGTDTISGTCGAEGDNVLWALNLGSGKMVVSGTGDMADYASSADTPWADRLSSIQTVTVQNGVTSIGDHAFGGCVPLSDVTIGDDVTRIGAGAFAATQLTAVTVPASVTEIGADAFACGVQTEDGFTPTLRRIDVNPDNTAFSSSDDVLFNKAQTTLLLYPAAKPNGVYMVPDTVTYIEIGAFKGTKNLTSVHVPYTVTQIGQDAFADCGALEYICCDVAGSFIEAYAASSAIPFRYCDGHTDTSRPAGDANGDGIVDLKDVVMLRRYLADWDGVVIYGRLADVNADNAVTLQDVVLLTRYLAGGWDVVLR